MAAGNHVGNASGRSRVLITAALTAALLVAAYLLSSLFFVIAGGSLIPRGEKEIDLSGVGVKSTGALLRLKDPQRIDLRGNDIDAGEYKALAAAFPNCEILWDVPLGGVGESWDKLSESVKVPVFAPEKAELYAYMPNLKEIDLRDAIMSPEDYELLKSLVPHCRIIWEIPIAGEYYDSSSLSLSFGDIAPEDVKLFAYFDSLETLELTGSTHQSYIELERLLPECAVIRSVSMGQAAAPGGESLIDLRHSGVSAAQLTENLAYLPEVRTVILDSEGFSKQELRELREAYPRISFEYDIRLGSKTHSCMDAVVTPGEGATAEEILDALGAFVSPERLDLRGCGLSVDQLLEAAELCPGAMVQADVELYGKSFTTDSREIDLSGIKIEDSSLIERALPLFPNLSKVIMSDCGISDEDMDALDRRHEDVHFVWTLHFSVYDVRTDVTAFCASNVPGYVAPKLSDQQLAPIKYLRSLEALDLGHMYYTDLSFLENMPHLRYLILVEANYRDISAIAGLSELYYLELFNNTINDLSPLLECKKLRHLNIGYTKGYDASVLKEMTWLERLWYPGGFLDDGLAAELEAALGDTDCYFVKWDGSGSTGGGWREDDSYYIMRDMFEMHYMPGGTGVPQA